MRLGQSTRPSTDIGKQCNRLKPTHHPQRDRITCPEQNLQIAYKSMLPISSPIRHCLYHTSTGVVSNTSKLVQILTQMWAWLTYILVRIPRSGQLSVGIRSDCMNRMCDRTAKESISPSRDGTKVAPLLWASWK